MPTIPVVACNQQPAPGLRTCTALDKQALQAVITQLSSPYCNSPWSLRVQYCTALWRLASDAEALQARVAGAAGGECLEGAGAALIDLQGRLAGLRGIDDAPHAVWVRAATAVDACRTALDAQESANLSNG